MTNSSCLGVAICGLVEVYVMRKTIEEAHVEQRIWPESLPAINCLYYL